MRDGDRTPAPAASIAPGGDLARGADALRSFRARVHAMLVAFEDGPAGPGKLAAHRLTRADLGAPNTPFPEADDLYAQYRRVHLGLVKLSRSLTEQIECLSIAVHGAEVGFDNLEEDQRRRFWSIRARTESLTEREGRADA
ncbi:hypothetical protein GCM10010329_56570 [Streptomyces spiroverticillatus]|uniref:Uncharacterized protein n=1 Tax=Streptomyces finlayi TaxID=67296 RepID=A0A919CC84_9ACTN|nr:hypothetical protein [Streptomyces finlayi]GHA25877.1 hypothetical protein GCM10010329_56570 [Streptomyces spiroverticillatus]GHD05147.1 hypothetical protein GCM10010334_55240 [Streptomyces finlayi]